MSPIAQAVEIVDLPIYDTEPYVKQSKILFFAVPFGGSDALGNTKGIVETDVFLPGLLESCQAFLVHALRVAMFDKKGIIPAGSNVYADSHVDFRINRKTYWQGPAWKVADPAAMIPTLAGLGEDARKEAVSYLRSTFDPPVYINPQELFNVLLILPTYIAEPLRKIVVLLEGSFVRPVM